MINAARPLSTHFMYSLLNTYTKFEKTAGAQTDLLERQTIRDFAEMQRIEDEKRSKIQELAKTNASERNWSLISSTTQNIITGSTLAVGAFSLASGGVNPASVLMLASGVTSAASRIFQYTGAYNKVASWMSSAKEMQEKIASRLEIGTQCVAAGLGLASGITAAVRSNAVTNSITKMGSWISPEISAKISPWFAPVASMGQKAIELKKSFVEKQSSHIGAFLQQSESLIMQIFQRIHQTGKDAERLVHTVGDICEAIKQAVYTQHTRI